MVSTLAPPISATIPDRLVKAAAKILIACEATAMRGIGAIPSTAVRQGKSSV